MRDIRLHNTMSGQLESITPINAGVISLYTCGLTVYDYGHIGNFRTFLFYDILRRTLENANYTVNHVMNVTDVGHLVSDADDGQDKLEKGAAREGRTAWEIASYYIEAYHTDRARLNILAPSVKEPRATDYIPEQIALVEELERRGFTYAISDGIYFDTGKLDDYGKLAHLDIEGLQAGIRVELNPEKRNPTDFALWKFSPTNEQRQMEWKSPWGIGFPGWHLECSAMAMKLLGDTIDIHCGGIDHIPVHHTNEIAQSEAATGKPFSNLWLHAEFLLVDGGKMSKSKGNFYTIQDLMDRGYNPLAFRYLTLTAHYRSKMNFTMQSLDSAQSALNALIYRVSTLLGSMSAPDSESMNVFNAALDADLNTPIAVAELWNILKSGEPSDVKLATVLAMDSILGLDLVSQAEGLKHRMSEAGSNFAELLEERELARREKDWATADSIRDEITASGFAIEDTPDGPIVKPA